MIPKERAITCSHQQLVELSCISFRHREIACPACGWKTRIRLSYERINHEAYLAACVGYTFGERWAEQIYQSFRRGWWPG